jgi:hypothetical protein
MRTKLLVLLAWILLLPACATWQAPAEIDAAEFRERASVEENEGVTVRALVLTQTDGERLLGADVFSLGIEPVWLEVTNDGDQALTMLQSGADPDYFSPLEVSWSLHSSFAGRKNRAIDQHLQDVAFRRGPIYPGETRAGVIFTNPHHGVKLLNIDVMGENRFIPFTLFLPIPEADGSLRERREWAYGAGEMTDFSDEQAFREALDNWFASDAMAASNQLTQPLTLVWVGRPRDLGAALVRRGYRWGPLTQDLEQRLLGSPPDFVLRKTGQAGVPANWIRLWALPMSFQGRPVLVAQTGAPRGGRFASAVMGPEDEPAVDEVRDMVVQDMLYSGGMAKLAVFPRPVLPEELKQVTDGRVAVLFVAARPRGLADVRISDWERVDWAVEPAPYQTIPATQR